MLRKSRATLDDHTKRRAAGGNGNVETTSLINFQDKEDTEKHALSETRIVNRYAVRHGTFFFPYGEKIHSELRSRCSRDCPDSAVKIHTATPRILAAHRGNTPALK